MKYNKLLIALLFISACAKFPDDIVAPEFDISATIPLIDSLMTIDEVLDDTSLVKKSNDGNLYIAQTSDVYQMDYVDLTSFNLDNSSYKVRLNDQQGFLDNFNSPASAFVSINDLFTVLPPAPNTTIVPPTMASGIDQTASISLDEDIEYVTFSSGELNLRVTNKSDLDMDFLAPSGHSSRGFVYDNGEGSKTFIALNNQQAFIPANSSRGGASDPGGAIIINLKGLKITQNAKLYFTIHTDGSATPVSYTKSTGLGISINLSNQQIETAKAAMDSYDYTFAHNVPFTDGIKITNATISDFSYKLNFSNSSPVSGNVSLTSSQMKNSISNENFAMNTNFTSYENLYGKTSPSTYTIAPDADDIAQGGYINKFRAYINIKTNAIPRSNKQIFHGNDSMAINFEYATMDIASAAGPSSPKAEFNFSTVAELPIEDNAKDLQFSEVETGEISLKLYVTNTANTQAIIQGMAYIMNKPDLVRDSITITPQKIAPNTTTAIYINKDKLKLNSLPELVKLVGKGTLVDGVAFSFQNTDFIKTSAELVIPLRLALKDGSFTKMIDLKINDDVRDRQDNIDSGAIRLEIRNKIPSQSRLSLTFFDKSGNKLLTLPKDNPIDIGNPQLDNSGYSVAPVKSYNSINVNKDDINAILSKADKMQVRLLLEVGSNSKLASFRTSDFLHIKADLKFFGNNKEDK